MSEANEERSTRQPEGKYPITREQYDAVLLDLDGVITDTANIHAACWKQMFDEYLRKRAAQRGEAFRSFDVAADYLLYVDGKPRLDGVRDFLKSRGIPLPEGSGRGRTIACRWSAVPERHRDRTRRLANSSARSFREPSGAVSA